MAEDHILYKDLSYQLNGIFFRAHNDLGRFCNEKQVCDYLMRAFEDAGIRFEFQKVLPPSFAGESVGRNKVDLLIEDSIAIEIKCKRFITKEDYYQVRRYLAALNKKLGILVNFRDIRLQPKRILNANGNI